MVERELYLPDKLRTETAPPFRLTNRDVLIIQAVHHYRMLELRQMERLFFQTHPESHGNLKRCQKRLRLLYLQGYLERIPRPIHPTEGSKGPVYRLGVSGAKFLAEQKGLPLHEFHYWGRGDDKDARRTQVQPLFLEHGLELAEVRLAVELSTLRHDLKIEAWQDEVELRRAHAWDAVKVALTPKAKKERVAITPDSYFVLTSPRGRAHFFLEVDRSNETIAQAWRRKIMGYKEYVISDGFRKRYAISGPETPLRILTTTHSLDRAHNLKAAAERYGLPEVTSLFLFAPLFEVTSQDPLTAPMWLRAGDTQRYSLI